VLEKELKFLEDWLIVEEDKEEKLKGYIEK